MLILIWWEMLLPQVLTTVGKGCLIRALFVGIREIHDLLAFFGSLLATPSILHSFLYTKWCDSW